jgi:hypothetical protein
MIGLLCYAKGIDKRDIIYYHMRQSPDIPAPASEHLRSMPDGAALRCAKR